MRGLIGFILLFIGGAMALYGLGSALSAFAGLYQGAINDALNQPEGTEKAVADGMWRSALIGLSGVPLMMVGSFMLGRGLIARMRGRSDRRD